MVAASPSPAFTRERGSHRDTARNGARGLAHCLIVGGRSMPIPREAESSWLGCGMKGASARLASPDRLQPVAQRVPQHAGDQPGAAEALATGKGGQGRAAKRSRRPGSPRMASAMTLPAKGERHALAGIAGGDVDAGAEPADQWQPPERDRDHAAPGVVDAGAGELRVELQEMPADERGRVGRLASRIASPPPKMSRPSAVGRK